MENCFFLKYLLILIILSCKKIKLIMLLGGGCLGPTEACTSLSLGNKKIKDKEKTGSKIR